MAVTVMTTGMRYTFASPKDAAEAIRAYRKVPGVGTVTAAVQALNEAVAGWSRFEYNRFLDLITDAERAAAVALIDSLEYDRKRPLLRLREQLVRRAV